MYSSACSRVDPVGSYTRFLLGCSFICVTHLKTPVWEPLIAFYKEGDWLPGIFHTLTRLEMRLGVELRPVDLSGSPCRGVMHYGETVRLCPVKNFLAGTKEMAQCLRVCMALPERPEFGFQHPYQSAHNHLELQVPAYRGQHFGLLWTPAMTCA